jgi:ribose transport system permease protein
MSEPVTGLPPTVEADFPPTDTPPPTPQGPAGAAWRRLLRERPIIPLTALLFVLIGVYWVVRPGVVNADWAGVMLRAAVPLAILAGCQTLTMLTGGIDLSVGAVASMAGFMVASLVNGPGLEAGLAVALIAATAAGLLTGIGVGIFRVHPLIMSLGVSFVVLGLANAWQILMVQSSTGVPPALRTLGSERLAIEGLGPLIPYSFLVFLPLMVLILLALRRTGYGRMLFAIGDNPVAARLSGARSWQLLVVLYVVSALMAAVAGFLLSGLTNVASVTLADSLVLPSIAAAVIGGTSIFGGRGGYGGTIVGAMILTVISALLTALGYPEAVRQILFGAIIVAVAALYARVTAES